MSRKEIEDLVESNKIPSTVKDRFCDNNAEDNQELSNEVQQEMDLRQNTGQVMETLKHDRINSCPSMLVRSDS